MSATDTDGTNSTANTSNAQWVLIPLAIVIVITAAAFVRHCVHLHRQNRSSLRNIRSSGGEVYGRAEDTAVVSEGTTASRTHRRLVRMQNCWAWARYTSSGGVVARCEEGLNELGQAPPPYDGRKIGDGVDKEDIEGRPNVQGARLPIEHTARVSEPTTATPPPRYVWLAAPASAPSTPQPVLLRPLERQSNW